MKIATNVWVPVSAVDALDEIKAREGHRSRNRTLACLLGEYLDDQLARGPEDRLVHVATLLRWPPPRREDSREAGERGVPSHGKQLRVNVEEELWLAARDQGFVLPGQSPVRGHPEYQARRGADAVLAAIARRRPLVDTELGQIEQLLTRRQANALWRLAVAGTSTTSERLVEKQAENVREIREVAEIRGDNPQVSDRVVRVAEKLRTSQVTWHASERFASLRAIAFNTLSGPGAQDFLDLLDQADDDTESWRDELARVRKVPVAEASREGRGATAVWRAEREVETENLMDWFSRMYRTSTPTSFVVRPPGWMLRFPTQWVPTRVTDGMFVDRDAAQLLQIHHAGEVFTWPTRENGDGLMVPVPGFEIVISEAARRPVREVLEATLIDFSQELHTDGGMYSVWVPAHVAHDLGLIDEAERDRLASEARAAHDADLERAEDDSEYTLWIDLDVLFADLYRDFGERERARMAFARGFRPFVKYLKEIEHPALKSMALPPALEASYRFPMTTLAEVVQAGELKTAAIRWLSAYVFSRSHAILNVDMRQRWDRAQQYAEYDEYDEDDDRVPTPALFSQDASDPVAIIANEVQPSTDPNELPF